MTLLHAQASVFAGADRRCRPSPPLYHRAPITRTGLHPSRIAFLTDGQRCCILAYLHHDVYSGCGTRMGRDFGSLGRSERLAIKATVYVPARRFSRLRGRPWGPVRVTCLLLRGSPVKLARRIVRYLHSGPHPAGSRLGTAAVRGQCGIEALEPRLLMSGVTFAGPLMLVMPANGSQDVAVPAVDPAQGSSVPASVDGQPVVTVSYQGRNIAMVKNSYLVSVRPSTLSEGLSSYAARNGVSLTNVTDIGATLPGSNSLYQVTQSGLTPDQFAAWAAQHSSVIASAAPNVPGFNAALPLAGNTAMHVYPLIGSSAGVPVSFMPVRHAGSLTLYAPVTSPAAPPPFVPDAARSFWIVPPAGGQSPQGPTEVFGQPTAMVPWNGSESLAVRGEYVVNMVPGQSFLPLATGHGLMARDVQSYGLGLFTFTDTIDAPGTVATWAAAHLSAGSTITPDYLGASASSLTLPGGVGGAVNFPA